MKLDDIELVDYKINVHQLHALITNGTNLIQRYLSLVIQANVLMEQYPNINQVRFSANGKMSVSFHR